METYHKIQTLFKRDLDGSLTGKKGKMIEGRWTTPELEYLADNEWEFTEKVDGTNIRIGLHRYQDSLSVEFGGRSDNAAIPVPLLNWLKVKFPDSPTGSSLGANVGRWMVDNNLTDVILFGEGYGPKIQNGGLYSDEQKFVLFDVKIGNWWLYRDAVDDIAKTLDVESVPTVGFGTLHDGIELVRHQTFKSQWGDFLAEGVVARPKIPMFDRKGERIITKIKAVDFR